MTSIQLRINHEIRTSAAPSETPLIYVLRNEFGLHSPRLGCGLEQCGSCRVMVDGELAFSCTRTLGSAAGCEVLTVEGLADDTALHPVQDALLELNAGQCGYCLSGIILTAKHLLDKNPAPTRDEVKTALDANLCRCGSHNRVLRAIESVIDEQ